MPYVTSTLATDMCYTTYKPPRAGFNGKPVDEIPQVDRKIFISGKAGVAQQTPQGVLTLPCNTTFVSDEDLKVLESHPVFIMHKEGGYLKIHAKNAKPAVISKDMNLFDKSAPANSKTFRDSSLAQKKGLAFTIDKDPKVGAELPVFEG